MKIKPKSTQNAEADLKSGNSSGDSSGDSNEQKKENTNTAKAQKIVELGYSQRSLSTLERLSSQELDFILREKRDPLKDELSKKTIESSKEIVGAYITSLEAIKKARCDKELNQGFKSIAQAQSGVLGEYVGVNAGGYVGLALLIISSIALAIDAIFGLENLKSFFQKKEQKKEDKK